MPIYDGSLEPHDEYGIGAGSPWLTACFCGRTYRGMTCTQCGRSSLPRLKFREREGFGQTTSDDPTGSW